MNILLKSRDSVLLTVFQTAVHGQQYLPLQPLSGFDFVITYLGSQVNSHDRLWTQMDVFQCELCATQFSSSIVLVDTRYM